MNIIPIIQNFTMIFNKKMNTNINPYNLEQQIITVGDEFTIKLYEEYLNNLDIQFKKSPDRLNKYIIKETKLKNAYYIYR